MDEKALFEAIRAIVKEETTPINTWLEAMQNDMATMQGGIGTINTRLDSVESRLDALSADMAWHNNEIAPMLKTILENTGGQVEQSRRLQMLHNTAEDHETRIWALEKAAKA